MIRLGVVIGVGVTGIACQGPPGEVAPAPIAEAGPAADAGPDGAVPDAPPSDAPPDAAGLDAAKPDAPPPDAGVPDAVPLDPDNPFGILLTEATAVAFGTTTYGAGEVDEDTWGIGAGAALGDLNGDGHLDLVLARIDNPLGAYPGGPSELLINDGAGHFTNRVEFATLMPGAIAHSATLGDYDVDGDLDVFIGAHGADYLLQNDGTGQFTDVTATAGVAGPSTDATVGAIFVDVNHDGLLDLYVAENIVTTTLPDEQGRNRLHLNVGDGTFVDVSSASLSDVLANTQAVAAFDLSDTGDLDLYVANDGVPGDAWLRLVSIDDQGVPIFQDVAVSRGVYTLRASMGVAIADLDGDQTPDLYISDWGENDLYLNPAPGSPVTLDTGYGLGIDLDPWGVTMISWSVRFVDLDLDGNLSLFVVTGGVGEIRFCTHFHQLDWFLRRASPGVGFHIITGRVGLPDVPVCGASTNPINGRGAVWGDIDGDQDLDVVVTPYLEEYRVYRNDTPPTNHSVRVRLAGTVSSPDPIGATLRVIRTDGRVESRFRYAGGDTYSQSDSVLAVGLGSATSVSEAVIFWPSGLIQRIDGLPGFAVDTTMYLVEPNWLSVTPRVVEPTDPPAHFVYQPVDNTGVPLGVAGAGRIVAVTRSDGVACPVIDMGDGTYVADLPHPGVARRTVLSISVDGAVLRPRPMVNYN